MLNELINGGVPYLVRDGAYPDFDGFLKLEQESGLQGDIDDGEKTDTRIAVPCAYML